MPDESEKTFSRRSFFRGAAAAVGGAVLPRDLLFPQPTPLEIEPLDPWETKKRAEIDKLFERQKDGSFNHLVNPKAFIANGLGWQEIPERSAVDALNSLLRLNEIPVQLKCTYRTLLNKAVERYNALVIDPYSAIIDPGVKEVEDIINLVNQITGLPPDFIKTIAWRENGLRGTIPTLHGDSYCPTIGAGFINLELDIFGKTVKIGTEEHPLVRTPGTAEGYVLPVTTTALKYDAMLGTLIPMAICLEHLEKVFSERDNSIANLRNEFMNIKFRDLNPDEVIPEKLARFTALAYSIYHHGIYAVFDITEDNQWKGRYDTEGNLIVNFSVISNKRFLREITEFDDIFFEAYNTFLYNRPWFKPRYRLAGTGEAAGHEFYCPFNDENNKTIKH